MVKPKIYKIRIGSTLHICDSEALDLIRAKAIAALKKGKEIEWYDRSLQWLDSNPIIDINGKSGSDIYTWDDSGNKIKHEITLNSLDLLDLESEVVNEVIGYSWRNYS